MLPRELRDEIYSAFADLSFKTKLPSQHEARLRARRALIPELLRINRQFRDEYLESAAQKTALVIVDRAEYEGSPIELPQPLHYVRKLELHLAIACSAYNHVGANGCRVLRELRMHRKWITGLSAQMRHQDQLTIKLLLEPHHHVDDCEQRLLDEQSKFTNIQTLTLFEVYRCEYTAGRDEHWNFGKPRTLVMKWDGDVLQRVATEVKQVATPTKGMQW